jgi:hypothetical protein
MIVKGSLHEHFISGKNGTITRARARDFWRRIQKAGFDFVAITPHAHSSGTIAPERINRILEETMPQKLKNRGFKMIPAIEFMSREGIDVIAIHSKKEVVFDPGFRKISASLGIDELCTALKKRGCRMVLPHPNTFVGIYNVFLREESKKEKRGARGRAAERAVELLKKHRLGIEQYHGTSDLYTRLIRRTPTLGLKGLKGFKGRLLHNLTPDAHPALVESAAFLSAGGDSHSVKNVGNASFSFEIPEKLRQTSLSDFINSFSKKIEISRHKRKTLAIALREFAMGSKEGRLMRKNNGQKKQMITPWKAIKAIRRQK